MPERAAYLKLVSSKRQATVMSAADFIVGYPASTIGFPKRLDGQRPFYSQAALSIPPMS